jgi:hypothetical protein
MLTDTTTADADAATAANVAEAHVGRAASLTLPIEHLPLKPAIGGQVGWFQWLAADGAHFAMFLEVLLNSLPLKVVSGGGFYRIVHNRHAQRTQEALWSVVYFLYHLHERFSKGAFRAGGRLRHDHVVMIGIDVALQMDENTLMPWSDM